ncbi:TadE/TadG family type IV pilus assembly protein [Magnetospirillum aberrantis]|uniref:VWA domain-containing protein n=1 Tax=Magnetospirillum aberrantis SpK TaxID=908842 RepID=A0A7C9UWZ5_9PROT|nr:pilus assembly protein TadG-related protein [Magnetospirillum aberrantis]NFV80730.1 VWA domain-containing protein [Magnetospirillum aberrantis SpK]
MTRTLNALMRDRRGVVGIAFALTVTGTVLMMLAAMDLLRVSILRSRVQSALDNAVLAVGYNLAADEKEWKAEGQSYFAANMGENSMGSTLGAATFTSSKDSDGITHVTGSAKVSVPLMISGFTEAGAMEMSMSTSARKRTRANIEMVLALDNTGSMGSGNKMTEAKSAAKKLVETMLGAGTSGGNTYVGLVPFTELVRVGSTTETKKWLASGVDSSGWKGCLFERTSSDGEYKVENTPPSVKKFERYHDVGISYVEEYEEEYTEVTYEDYTYECGSTRKRTCSGRKKIETTLTRTKEGNCVPTESNADTCKARESSPQDASDQQGCSLQEVTFLSGDKTALDTDIEKMTALGSTMVASGVMWGWRMLDPAWRGQWTENGALPKDKASNLNKVLVLLTDGDNAVQNYCLSGYHSHHDWSYHCDYTKNEFRNPYRMANNVDPWGDLVGDNNINADNLLWNDPSSVDHLESYCDAAKKDGIVIYTIPFGPDDDISERTRAILKGCATDEEKYFRVTEATDLTATFKTITDTLSELVIEE